jgi:hypothetical protein
LIVQTFGRVSSGTLALLAVPVSWHISTTKQVRHMDGHLCNRSAAATGVLLHCPEVCHLRELNVNENAKHLTFLIASCLPKPL